MYILGGILLLTAIIIHKKSGSFFKSLFLSAMGGAGALCAVSALSYFFPISVGLNLYTLAFSVFYSVPGVILLLICNSILF